MSEVPVGENKIVLTWNKSDAAEVEEARRKFDEYTRQAWFAYVEKPDGTKHVIYDFDPSYEKIIFVHAITGG